MTTNQSDTAPAGPIGQRPVFIVDGARTPFLKVRGKPGPFSPVDLAVQCGRPLLLRQDVPLKAFDQVILGCVNVPSEEMNPARLAEMIGPNCDSVLMDPMNYPGQVRELFRRQGWDYALSKDYAQKTRNELSRLLEGKI